MERSQSCTSHGHLPLLLALSGFLFASSTILHLFQPGSLSELLVSFAGINVVSAVARLALEGIVSHRRAGDLAGILNGIFGVETCFAVVAVAKSESSMAQNALNGAQMSYCFMILGTCIVYKGRQQPQMRLVVTRLLSQLVILSFVVMMIQFAFELPFQGEFFTKLRTAATLLVSVQSMLLHRRQSTGSNEASRKGSDPYFSFHVSISVLLLSFVAMTLSSIYIVEASRSKTDTCQGTVSLALAAVAVVLIEDIPAALRYRKSGNTWLIDLAIHFKALLALSLPPLAVLLRLVPGFVNSMRFDGYQVVMLCLIPVVVNCLLLDWMFHWAHGLVATLIYLFVAATA